MAISSSGSVSLSQIQAEFGGSSPISLSEYYLSNLGSANTSGGVSEAPTVTSSTAITTGEKYNTTTHIAGFIHSSLASTITNSLNVGDNSDSWSYVTGADLVGEAGAVPGSGAISFNHLRGTAKGTSSSIICYGLVWVRLSNAILTTSTVRAYFGGHLGTNSQSGNVSWDGFPFTSISVGAEGNVSATTLTFSGTQTSNGSVGPKTDKNHQSNGTIGNYTQCFWSAANTTTQWASFSGTWSLTVNY